MTANSHSLLPIVQKHLEAMRNEFRSREKSWVEPCEVLIERLKKVDAESLGSLFARNPREALPPKSEAYTTKIKTPVWLGLVESRLRDLHYLNKECLLGDLRIMCENCYRFNEGNSDLIQKGAQMEAALEEFAAELTLCPRANFDEIRHRWRDLSTKEKEEALERFVVRYEGPTSRIQKEVSKRRLLEYLRSRRDTARYVTTQPVNTSSRAPSSAIPVARKRGREQVPVLNAASGVDNDHVEFHKVAVVTSPTGKPKPLPQNHQQHTFFEDVSPMGMRSESLDDGP